LAVETPRRRGNPFQSAFVIETSLSPTQVVEQLSPIVRKVGGFWGWVDFWMTWDGLSKTIKFAGQLGESSFRLRRVHGLRFRHFVSVTARGEIQPVAPGSRIVVTIVPTLEELWPTPLFLLFIAVNAFESTSLVEGLIFVALAAGLPFAWFAHSRARESREAELLLRSLLERHVQAGSVTLGSSQ
jgi:hypothetical protein